MKRAHFKAGWRLLLLVTLAGILLLGQLLAVGASAAQFSTSKLSGGGIIPPAQMGGGVDRIAFTSNRDGNYEVYVMAEDGSGQTRLTNNPADDGFPFWSPDGTEITFSSSRDGNTEVYKMAASGASQTNLTNNPAWDQGGAWSPDGTKIAFFTNRDNNFELYIMTLGCCVFRVTNRGPFDGLPAWSPDGSKIAFTSKRDGNLEVYVVNADGTNPVNLTNSPDFDAFPAWSPEGNKIAFTSIRGSSYEVYVMNADGSNPVNVSNDPTEAGFPAWSPDGTKIAFTSKRAFNMMHIWVMNADGSNPVQLTTNPAEDWGPSWALVSAFVAETELGLGVDTDPPNDKAAGTPSKVVKIVDPITGQTVAINVVGYFAGLTYFPSGINIMDIRGKGPFGTPTKNINNQTGQAQFNASHPTGAPAALTIALPLVRLVGSNKVSYTLTQDMSVFLAGVQEPIMANVSTRLFRRGDCRADGVLNVADALFGAQHLANLRQIGDGLTFLNPVNCASVKYGDVGPNLDKVNIADILFVAQYLVGLRDEFFNPK